MKRIPTGLAAVIVLIAAGQASAQMPGLQPSPAETASQHPNLPPLTFPDNRPPSHTPVVAATPAIKAAAEAGDPGSQFLMGQACAFGAGVGTDMAKSRAWYVKAAAQDFMPAMINLAQDYITGMGGPKDIAGAIDLYTRLVAKGMPMAGTLANLYQTQGDTANAALWYQKAAAAGEPYAAQNLAQLYLTADPARALGMLQDLATQDDSSPGFATTLNELADMYYFGQGTAVDYAKAYPLYLKAANLGYPPAQHRVGSMLYQVQGVAQDDLSAFAWLKLAADNKDADGIDDFNTVKSDIKPDQMKIIDARVRDLRKAIEATQKQRWDAFAASMEAQGKFVIPPTDGFYPHN